MLAVRYLRRSQYTTISGLVRDLYGTKTKIEEPKIEEFKVKKNVKTQAKNLEFDVLLHIIFIDATQPSRRLWI